MYEKNEPLLSFDYVDPNGNKGPFTFKNPRTIITTNTVNEVLACLKKVQAAIDDGYYAAGYVSYEAAPAFDPAFQVNPNSEMPLLWFGIFNEPVHEPLEEEGPFQLSEWEPSATPENYKSSIEKIKKHIAAGDTYQVNFTIRLQAHFTGDTKAYYKQLAEVQSADYAAYIDTGDHTILSASPELFFQLNNGKITTRPMKGTVKRGKTAEEDKENAAWLYQSAKNRAENVMIVDLLRNDLGTISKIGSVEVPHLFTIEKYPTVYQMTSTITAETETDFIQVFKALFPCGSITGAPKISTMNIINELETTPRDVYCGAIGYITPNKQAVFNVPIRTVSINNETGKALYGVGGGITWDSTVEEEYEEMQTKARFLKEKQASFQLLETFGLIDGSYIAYEQHIFRLEKSAAYFDFSIDLTRIQENLAAIAHENSTGSYRGRLLVEKDGTFTVDVADHHHIETPVNVALANEAVSNDNIFLYHKTTNRSVYKHFKKQHPESFDVLLWNENKEVTEFTIGNVVVELDGNLYTPPVACGLLPGTFRQKLLDENKITERKITVAELKTCTGIWLVNSVRKWVNVKLFD